MKQMPYAEFRTIRQDQEYRLIDVREQNEYDEVHVQDVELFPLSLIREGRVPIQDGQRVALICRSGARSAMAAQILESKGFDEIINISDGTLGAISSAPDDLVRG